MVVAQVFKDSLLQCSGCLKVGSCAGERMLVVVEVKKGWLLLCEDNLVVVFEERLALLYCRSSRQRWIGGLAKIRRASRRSGFSLATVGCLEWKVEKAALRVGKAGVKNEPNNF